jgi:hypothetical membrane protein
MHEKNNSMTAIKTNSDLKTKLLLWCGTLGSLLFILVFWIEGILRDHYSALRYPISSLSIGDSGWIQVTSFIVTGSLFAAFAIGLKRSRSFAKVNRSVPWLVGLTGTGLIGAGIFSTDPVYGYPPGQPFMNAEFSLHGHLHEILSLLVFLCLPATCFVAKRYFVARKDTGWALYSVITGIVMFSTFILTGFAFRRFFGLGEVAGLIQRVCVIVGFSWIALVSLHLSKPGNQ